MINPRNDSEDDFLATFIPMPGIPQNYRGPLGGEVRSWGEIKKSFTHFADGDIALAKITPCFQNGKSAVFHGLKNGIGAGTTELHVARPIGDPVFPEYVWIFLKSPLFIAEGIPVMTGTAGQKRVPTGYFALKPFPLPPLAEQKRIVAKVDELMALCDRLEAQQQERDTRHAALARASLARFSDAPTMANLNFLFHSSYAIAPADLRKIILKVAFDGSLTGVVPTTLSPNADALPNGWVLRDIASMCIIEDGDRGSCYPNKNDFSDSGHCVFLSTKNVRPDGFNFASLEWISKEKHNELRKGTLIRGDVVFTSRGTIGNIAHYDQDVPFNVMRINSGMFILRGFQKHMYPAFLSRLLRSPQISIQIEDLRSGSAQPQLPIREFRKFTAKIPPLTEQRRIVAKVDQLMALVDQLETQLTASRTAAINLMEALVTELAVYE